MKTFLLILTIGISFLSFSQDAVCKATVVGNDGSTFFKKTELKLIHKIDLDKDCKYKILAFSVEFTDAKKSYYEYDIPGGDIPDKVYKNLIKADKKITFFNILVGSGLKTDSPIELPKIILTMVK